ncbi:MAG: SpoIVB peptidase [Sporomusaceae bacterium]|nr:SpoIVB peptidase [Sporomusaceae bacterium]
MDRLNKRSVLGIISIMLLVSFCLSPQFQHVYSIPPTLRMIEGEPSIFTVSFPLTIVAPGDFEQVIKLNPGLTPSLSKPVAVEPFRQGKTNVEIRLLGIIPLRTVEVDVLPPIRLIPGGHSIGVVLRSQGVIIVGHSPVKDQNGEASVPAKDAGIMVGDSILSMNGIPIKNDYQVAEIIDSSGKKNAEVDLLIKRQDKRMHFSLRPLPDADTQRYRIGLYVRDSAAGVGTLTFFDEQTQTYGALGHVITDNDTNQPIDCEEGKIVMATVSGIHHGKRGQPGEKIGVFIEEDQIIGDIQKNTNFGIYGKLNSRVPHQLYPESLPVASMSQVQTGPAQMLTVIDGEAIEAFAIEIQKINLQDSPEGKGLVIQVTDPRLLEKTGGIVQGMSGSPIIQNGKIVGAVTHVFVHDPSKGYGCFMDWMLMESGLIPKKSQQTAKRLFSWREQWLPPRPAAGALAPLQ